MKITVYKLNDFILLKEKARYLYFYPCMVKVALDKKYFFPGKCRQGKNHAKPCCQRNNNGLIGSTARTAIEDAIKSFEHTDEIIASLARQEARPVELHCIACLGLSGARPGHHRTTSPQSFGHLITLASSFSCPASLAGAAEAALLVHFSC